jgi:predicted nucleic acid-binding protein
MVYVLDTNIIIHYLRDNQTVINHLEIAIENGNNIVIPYVVDYEIRRGYEIKPAKNKEAHYDILSKRTNFCTVASMGDGFWATAAKVYAEIYNKHLTVGENDIQIAAFTMYNGYTLVTNNTDDFKNITGLQFVDWTK